MYSAMLLAIGGILLVAVVPTAVAADEDLPPGMGLDPKLEQDLTAKLTGLVKMVDAEQPDCATIAEKVRQARRPAAVLRAMAEKTEPAAADVVRVPATAPAVLLGSATPGQVRELWLAQLRGYIIAAHDMMLGKRANVGEWVGGANMDKPAMRAGPVADALREAERAAALLTGGVESVPVKAGELLFADDFSTGTDNWLLFGPHKAVKEQGSLRLIDTTAEHPDVMMWTKKEFDGNFVAEFTFTPNLAGDRPGALFTICGRPRPGKDLSVCAGDRMDTYNFGIDGYHFSMHRGSTGLGNVRRVGTGLKMLASGPDPCPKVGQAYRVQIGKWDNVLLLFVDGKMIHNYYDAATYGPLLQSGRIGIRHWSGMDGSYRDFRICRLVRRQPMAAAEPAVPDAGPSVHSPMKTQTEPGGVIPLWGRFETTIRNEKAYPNPFADVELLATLTSPKGRAVKFAGFFDGDGQGGQAGSIWKLRFMPDETGLWKYEATFSDGTPGASGQFECVAGKLHGPIRPNKENPYWFQHADGTPFLLHAMKYIFIERLDRADRTRLIDVLNRQHRFNAVMGPHVKSGDSRGGRFDPWICNPYWNGKTNDFDRYSLKFWQRMDEVLDDLGRAGMILIPFGMVGGTNSDMVPLPPKPEQRVRYARYWTARWAGYWNATFQPQSEYEENKVLKDRAAEEVCRAIAQLDPWNHLISVHSLNVADVFARSDWFSYHTVQGGSFHDKDQGWGYGAMVQRLHQKAAKPVFFHECIWEANQYRTCTGNDPNVIRRSAWQMVLGGGAICYSDEVMPIHWSRFVDNVGKEPLGRSYAYLDILYDFVSARPYQRMQPHNDLLSKPSEKGIVCLAEPGREYIVFFHAGGEVTLDLKAADGATLDVKWLDPRTGKVLPADKATAAGGKPTTFAAPGHDDWVLWLAPPAVKGP